MLRYTFAILAVLACPLVAVAEPSTSPASSDPRWIVGAGIGAGGVAQATDNGDPFSGVGSVAFAEVLFRPARHVPVYLRAMYAGSMSTNNDAFFNARIGGEYRPCSGPIFCFVFDADVGYLHVTDICQDAPSGIPICRDSAPDKGGVSLNGRFGVDFGWPNVRVRLAVDATRAPASQQYSVTQYSQTVNLGSFAAFELGVAAAF
jgi:hypothetical protein